MSWQTEDGRHEGWAAAEFPGNRFSTGGGASIALVRAFGPGPGPLRWPEGEPETVDGREAIGWRGLCECGWRGPLWARTDIASSADTAAHLVYADPGPEGDEPLEVEEAIRGEWENHLEPSQSLDIVRIEAQAVNAAQARLTEAVRAAKTAGASWADIGSAVGVTRQSAHERWARPARAFADDRQEESSYAR